MKNHGVELMRALLNKIRQPGEAGFDQKKKE